MDKDMKKKLIILIATVLVIGALYAITNYVSSDYLENLGGSMPLPIFTLFIAIVDGFNPCNLFILTLLMSLMLTESHSRARIYAVGFSFIGVIYVFYFLFMAAWLNIFKYIGFMDPLRIGIALIAIFAGLINCKELFFYRKGITLMVQDKHVGPLKKRIAHVAEMMKTAKLPSLIGASIVLAIFSSLVELPCTAGFPIVYTGVLSGLGVGHGLLYYAYLALYNLIYVLPLIVIITVVGYTFKGRQISKEKMALIKFIGGAIMLLLGLVLLFNPGLIGL